MSGRSFSQHWVHRKKIWLQSSSS